MAQDFVDNLIDSCFAAKLSKLTTTFVAASFFTRENNNKKIHLFSSSYHQIAINPLRTGQFYIVGKQ